MYPFFPEFLGIKISLYGMMSGLGFFIITYYSIKNSMDLGITQDGMVGVLFKLILGALIGAKLLFIFLNWNLFWSLSFIDQIRSGYVYYGGAAGLMLIGIYVARSRNEPYIKGSDFFAVPVPLAHAVGRMGCFFAGCCYGKETDSSIAVHYTDPDSNIPPHLIGAGLYPTQLTEVIGNIILFFILLWLYKRKHKVGTIIAGYLIGYSILRFCVEFYRGDERGLWIGIFSPSQVIALIVITIVSILLTIREVKQIEL